MSSPSSARSPGPGPRRETGRRIHPAGKLTTCAPEDSLETILAELKQSTGRAIKIEALNLKLQHENKLLTTRLASSNSRLLDFKALNLLEFEALNPNLLCEDKLLVPLTEFPGAKESVRAGTFLSSQTESLLESGVDAKTKTTVQDDNPVTYSSGSGLAVDEEEDVTMKAKLPDNPEAEGPDIIDLTADTGEPTDMAFIFSTVCYFIGFGHIPMCSMALLHARASASFSPPLSQILHPANSIL